MRTLLFTHVFIQWGMRRCWHFVDVTYVGHKMKMQLEKKKGSRLELLAIKKGVRL